jgi:uncharacterized surface protein with fasciclin (FAS1) repeats
MNTRKNLLIAGVSAAALALTSLSASAHCGSCGTEHSDAKTSTEKASAETPMPNIVEIAVGNEDFTTLVAAIQAAGLVEILQGEGPFTVFAPTNEAFANLPDGTVESLLKPENKEMLIAVLTYHVVPGRVMAADVVELEGATTVQGSDITIKVTEEKVVMVDNATVLATDIEAGNGVIHVIDTVILPPTGEKAE